MHLSLCVCILVLRIEVLVYNIYEMNYDNMMAIHSIEVQEENWKLKSKIRELERENYELKAENKELKRDLEHRDTILSIMYDLVRCKYIGFETRLEIIKAVVDLETGATIQGWQKKLVDMFYHRDFLHINEESF